MAEIKNTFLKGKMNKDLDERLVPKGEYIDAMNIEVSTSEGSNVGTVQNILGNYELINPISSSDFSCIASISDEKSNRIYWFVTSQDLDMILEWDDTERKSSLVFVDPNKRNQNAALKFPNTHITGLNIIDEFLIWTDGINEPKKINIRKSKLGTDQTQTPINKHTTLVVDNVPTDIIATEKYITIIKKRPQSPPTVKINRNKLKSEKGIFEKVLPRFCYRYKYEDGEYSAFGPFTNVVFSAKHQDEVSSENFYSEKEGRNVSMSNSIESIELSDFVPFDMPEDVAQVDLLYKSENSNVVYSIANIKKKDKEFKANGSAQGVDDIYEGDFLKEVNKGKYTVTTENIYAAVPENQLLRPWDNVPKSAKAQEITGNRLVYGNYKQGYDLKESISLNASYERRNTRNNNFEEGGVETVKSLRDYQLGIVYGDKQGRETPVFSSSNSSVKIPWLNERYSTPNYYLPLCITGSVDTQVPDWASYFKFYIKETSGEYYNLLMDKLYVPSQSTDFDNKEDHVWLSFASSEINKITDQDYLVLKRVYGSKISPVEEKTRYKVIDISPEAPDSIAYNYFVVGEASNIADTNILANTEDDGAIFQNAERRIDKEVDVLEIDRSSLLSLGFPVLRGIGVAQNNAGVSNDSDVDNLYIAWKKVSADGSETHSKRYRIISNHSDGSDYRIKLSEKITKDDAALAANTAELLNQDLVFSIFRKELRDGEEFSGKFFVKIFSDETIKNKILNLQNNVSANKFVSSSQEMFWWYDTRAGGAGEIESILNAPSLGTLPNVISNNNDDAAVEGISNTSTEWDNILLEKGKAAFFIDNMFMSAANVSSSSYAKEAGQGVTANNVEYGEVEWQSNIGENEYPWSLNEETTWSQSDVNSANWSTNVQNFIPGIITSSADNIGQGKYVWKKSIFDTQENTNTYGEEPEGVFMHVSFFAPGKDLHDGSFDGVNNLDDVEVFGENSIAGLLKGIWGGGAFTDEFGAPLGQDEEGEDVKFVEFEGNYLGEDPLGDAPAPGIGKGYDVEYTEHHERQWDPTYSPNTVDINSPSVSDKDIEEFIKNIAIGRKFKFENDNVEELYTILDVSIKHVYNHTPWRSKWVYQSDGTVIRGGDSVEEAAVAWAKAKLNNNVDGEDVTLIQKIVDFGKASNRRTVYILRLDKDPTDATNNPLAGGTTDANFSISQKMQFVDSDAQANSGLVKDVEAVFETEPKEALDLNIFYEASQAIPTYLTLQNANQFAPVGCRVEFVNLPEARKGDENLTNTIHVGEWKHTDSGELAFVCQEENGVGPNARGFNKLNSNGVEIDYVDARVRFYRPDGGFTTCRLGPMQEAGQGNTGLRRLFIVNRVVDITEETGLGWFNCFSFGDGIESNRIEDDFNASFIKNGAKASTTLDEPYSEEHRKYGLIYSGLYNASSGLNNLNQFIQAEKITKDLNPTYGSIQKLFSRRADLIAFCEDRVIKILANKDAVFNADGNPQLVATTNVLGQATPFVGDYGISSNPESFSSESYRAYFTDKQRGAVLRLSMDGLTPISDAGMHDFFRDELPKAGVVLGTYDEYKRQYNITFKDFVYNNILKNSYLAQGDELNISSYVTEIVDNPNLDSGINYISSDINQIYQDAVDSNTELVSNNNLSAGVKITYFPGIAVGDVTAYQPSVSNNDEVLEDITVPNYGPIYTTINAGGSQQVQTNLGDIVVTQEAVDGVFPTYNLSTYLFRAEDFVTSLGSEDGIESQYSDHSNIFVNLNGADGLAASSGAYDGQSRGEPSDAGIALNNGDVATFPGTAGVGQSFSNERNTAEVRNANPGMTDYTVFNGEEVWVKINYRVEFYKANQNQWSNSTCSQANAAPNMDITISLKDGLSGDASGFRTTAGYNIGLGNWVGAGGTTTDNPWTSFGGDYGTDNYESFNAANSSYETYSWANANKKLLWYATGAMEDMDCSFTFTVPGVLVDGSSLGSAAYVDKNSSEAGYESEYDTVSLSSGATQNNLYAQRYTTSGGYRWYTERRSMVVKYRIFKSSGQLANTDVAIQQLQVDVSASSSETEKHKVWIEGFALAKRSGLSTMGSQSIALETEPATPEYDTFQSENLQVLGSIDGQEYGTLSYATDEYGNVAYAENLGDIDTGEDIVVSPETFTTEVLAHPESAIDPFVIVEHINPSNWAQNSSDGRVDLTGGVEEVYGPDNTSQVTLVQHTDELGNNYSYYTLQDDSGNLITDNGVTTYSVANGGSAITTYNGNSVDNGYYESIPTQETIELDNYITLIGYDDGDVTLSASSAKITQDVNLIHGNWYAVDVELEDDGYQITNETTNIGVNGGRLLLFGAITPELSVAAYEANHLNPGTNYPAGMFGQIHNVACVRFMPITVNYGDETREVFRVVFQANEATSNGLNTLEIGVWGNETAINVTRVDLIDVSLTGSGGNFSLNWTTNTTNNLVTALDQPVSYYQNGGWVWNLFGDENATLNTISQPLNNKLTQATIDGYTLSFEIANAPDSTSNEGSLNIYAVSNSWDDGQHRVISVTNIVENGPYSISFNLDGSSVGSVSQPDGSNIFADVSIEPSSSVPSEINAITILPAEEGFYGKLNQISIQDDSEIVSGGSTDAWVFTSFDQESADSNLIQPSSEYLFQNEQIVFLDALENIQVSQAISEEITIDETYNIQFNVDYELGSFDVYYFSAPGVGFYYENAQDSDGLITATILSDVPYEEGMIIGAIVFRTTSISNFSLDNITMTKVPTGSVNEQTLSYSEDVNGWVSFKSFIPESGASVSKKYFTFKNGRIYEHYHEFAVVNTFYNENLVASHITTLLNDEPGLIKDFKTLNYEGTQAKIAKHDSMGHDVEVYNLVAKKGWQAEYVNTNLEKGSVKEFIEKENKWFNYIKGAKIGTGLEDYSPAKALANLNFQGIGLISSEPVLMLDEEEDVSLE